MLNSAFTSHLLLHRRHLVAATQSTGPAEELSAPATAPDFNILDAAQPGCVLRAQLGGGSAAYLEITQRQRRSGGSVEALCEGELLRLGPAGAVHVGYWPRLSDAWVKSCPGLHDALKAARRQQEQGGALPSRRLQQRGVAALEAVTSLAALEADVAANAGPWCDGTGPGDPEPTDLDRALLSAGELLAFLQGRRGVVLVQLQLGFDPGNTLPLLRPLVLHLLQRAAGTAGVALLPSAAAGGVAVSLVLAAKAAPFRQWGAHLSAVGVQASLVADSPFYKLLVGRILGYKLENILHHVESHGGRLDDKVVAAVEEELRGLSTAQPQLPWARGRAGARH